MGFGGGWGGTTTLLSTTYYYYNENGNSERVVTQAAGSDLKTGVRMVYAKNDRTVTYTHNERWTGTGTSPEYFIDWAHEYRYDGARQRYSDRKLDPDDLLLKVMVWHWMASVAACRTLGTRGTSAAVTVFSLRLFYRPTGRG